MLRKSELRIEFWKNQTSMDIRFGNSSPQFSNISLNNSPPSCCIIQEMTLTDAFSAYAAAACCTKLFTGLKDCIAVANARWFVRRHYRGLPAGTMPYRHPNIGKGVWYICVSQPLRLFPFFKLANTSILGTLVLSAPDQNRLPHGQSVPADCRYSSRQLRSNGSPTLLLSSWVDGIERCCFRHYPIYSATYTMVATSVCFRYFMHILITLPDDFGPAPPHGISFQPGQQINNRRALTARNVADNP